MYKSQVNSMHWVLECWQNADGRSVSAT